jgi:hypothetical protein
MAVAEYAPLIRFLCSGYPPYLGRPLQGAARSLGDGIAGIVRYCVSDGHKQFEDSDFATRVLKSIMVAFSVPEYIMDPANRRPVNAIAIVDEIIKRNSVDDVGVLARSVHQDLIEYVRNSK